MKYDKFYTFKLSNANLHELGKTVKELRKMKQVAYVLVLDICWLQ